MHINDLLQAAVTGGASDLHLKVGSYPMMRVNGTLAAASEQRRLEKADTEAFANTLLPVELREKFERMREVDLAYSVPGLGRFRCNVFQQRGTIGLVLRVIPTRISSIDELGLPPVLKRIAQEERGLVLVTGSTGSGKSTTLAALIDHINATRSAHIMTIEDPIEYLHRDHRSLVNQREINVDTQSFSQALRSALRQDPDVILVGEMRDLDTVATALTAAETGHLILSTLHTGDAVQAIHRIIDVFPPSQQTQIKHQLAMSLSAIISQQLMIRSDGKGRVVAVEVLLANLPVRNHIRYDKLQNLTTEITLGKRQGMIALEDSLSRLVRQGMISADEARVRSRRPDELESQLRPPVSS